MRLIVCLLFLFSFSEAISQTYSVIHVSGKIYLASEDAYLTRGTRLDADSKLDFQSTGAKAAVLSSDRGRYVIQQSKKDDAGSDLAYVLSSVLTPARGRMSTRSGSINNLVDFQKEFESPKAWIADTMKVTVSPEAYPVNDQKFFFVRYDYKGEEVNKKLSSKGDAILFIKEEFYKVDEKRVEPAAVQDMNLFYYDAAKQTSTMIISIRLENVNKEEVIQLSESLGELPAEERVAALHELISTLYGECDPEQLECIISQS